MRRAPRRDEAEPEVIEALLAVGASVEQLSAKDVPDLLVGYRGKTFLLEVKTAKKKLKPGQSLWHTLWRGAPVATVRNRYEAWLAIGAQPSGAESAGKEQA